tara:strand:- start:2636 stop:3706 length:1071 start_codon:yes stop_codon:yes gene_type:complete
MRVVFRVDASFEIGIGHVMRCLSLALQLKKNGFIIEFICRKHQGNLIDTIISEGFSVYGLELHKLNQSENSLSHGNWLGATQYQDIDDCGKILKKSKVDWLIVDHYAIDQFWEQSLKIFYDKLLVIDDLSDRRHDCDLLLDQNFGRKQQDYLELVPESCEILLGSKYALMRDEFVHWRKYSLERRKKPELKNILISMGGVDINNFTGQVLEELRLCKLSIDVLVTIVLGINSPYLLEIKKITNDLPFNTELKINVNNMAEVMANADLAIGASGSTSWERCCLGLPAIQIVTAKNQDIIGEMLVRKNAIKLINDVSELPIIFQSALEWMSNLSSISKNITDGFGTKKVVDKIIQKEK